MKTKLPGWFLSLSLLSSPVLFAQDYDADEIRDFERYAHVGLSKGEIISIVVGVVLVLVAKSIRDNNQQASNVVGCLGILAGFPLLMVLLAVAQKVLAYGLVLALIVGGIYFLLGKKS